MSGKVATTFWVVAGVAVIWNLLGVGAYMADVSMTADDMAKLKPAMQDLYANRPAWATAAFAVAVFAGLLGSLLLLVRKRLATPVLLVSLFAILIQNFYNFGVAKVQAADKMGGIAFAMPALVLLIAVYLIYFSRVQTKAGVLT